MPTMMTDSRRSDDEDASQRGPRVVDDGGKLRAIHSAIVATDPKRLKEACKKGADRIDSKFTDDIEPAHAGMTSLALAAALNQLELVRILLDSRANPNASFANLRTTALMTSSFHGHVEVVRLLIERGADARSVDLQGSTALGYCFGGSRNLQVVEMLIRAGVDVNRKNMLGMNALLLVAGYGNDELIKAVLKAGADPNSTNDFGHSALHLAIVGKRSQIGAVVSGKSSPLYGLNRRSIDQVMKDWARERRDLLGGGRVDDAQLEKIGRFMTGVGEKLIDDPDGLTSDDQEAVKKRLDAVNRYRQDLISSGKSGKKSGVMDTFLSCGGRRGKQAKNSSTNSAPSDRPMPPLMTSGSPEEDRNVAELCEKFARIIRLLLDSGCTTGLTEKTFGMTALDMAILLGDIESVVLLTAAGADSDHLMKLFALSDLYGDIAIKPDKKRVKDLLNNDEHVDVNAAFTNFNVTKKSEEDERWEKLDGFPRGDEGLTPLAVAGKAQDNRTVEIIKMLIKHGGDINKIGPGGRSTLGEAARMGNAKMVEFLIGQGANLEQENPAFKNATALIIAVISKQTAVVEHLLSQWAKVDAQMSDGRTALDKAMEASDMPMIDTLLERCELSRNFHSPSSLPYRLAEEYKKPDRNIQHILNQISENVRAISEREKEIQRREEQERERINQTPSTMMSYSTENHDFESEGRQSSKRSAPKNQASESRSSSKNKRSSQSQKLQQQVVPPQPVESSEEEETEEEESEVSEESEMDIPEPEPVQKSKKSSKDAAVKQQQQKQKQLQEQELLQKQKEEQQQQLQKQQQKQQKLLEKQQQEEQLQKQQKQAAIKTKGKVTKEEEEIVVSSKRMSTGQDGKPSKKTPVVQAPPPPKVPPPAESESEEEESEESEQEDDEEEEPELQLATNAGLGGVAKYPPIVKQQQVTREVVVKGGTVNSSRDVVTKTTVTKTVVTTTGGHIATAERAQIVTAESSSDGDSESEDGESEEESEESEEEEEAIEDVNKNMAKVKVGGQKGIAPSTKKSSQNHSNETDI